MVETTDTGTQAFASAQDTAHEASLSWTASEFIAHHKSTTWYLWLGGIAAFVAGLIYILTRDVVSCSMVIIGAVLFGFYARRQPRQLPYRLNHTGLHIGQRFYELRHFRSFSVVPEGAFSSIVFMPLKRFAVMTTIYYAPQDEEQIVAILSAELPYVEHRHDPIERLMRLIRF